MLEFSQIENGLYRRGYKKVCGVDEVGRGPLAGPVVAAAVIFPEGLKIDGLDDSKKITPLHRERIFDEIVSLGLPCAVGIMDNHMIDRMNIFRASMMAMRKAVMELEERPDFVLIDGKFTIPKIVYPQMSIVKGDSSCMAIAAASIVAKVTRDRIMDRYEGLYPSFTFSIHKGYTTEKHMQELNEFGPCEIHRRSFKPVAKLVEEYVLF